MFREHFDMCSLVKDLKLYTVNFTVHFGILREFKSNAFTLRVSEFKKSSGKESPTA